MLSERENPGHKKSPNKGTFTIFCRTAVLLTGFRLRAGVRFTHVRTGGKYMPNYSLLDELTPVVFVSGENVFRCVAL